MLPDAAKWSQYTSVSEADSALSPAEVNFTLKARKRDVVLKVEIQTNGYA